MGKQVVVAKDAAEVEFDRFVEMMDLDVDPEGWDDEDKKSFVDCKRKIIGAIMDGRLVVDDNGQPVFTPSGKDAQPITFHEPTGASLIATDAKKQSHAAGKSMRFLADITQVPEVVFSKMASRDLKVCQSIVILFLA